MRRQEWVGYVQMMVWMGTFFGFDEHNEGGILSEGKGNGFGLVV